jgi:hypothetical protein
MDREHALRRMILELVPLLNPGCLARHNPAI